MSMMVNPVSMSNVRFTGEPTNVLERPGAFTRPATEQAAPAEGAAKPKKKHTALKIIGALAVVAAALVTLNKTNVLKVLDDVALKDAGFMKKVGHYVSKAGEFIAKYTYDPVVKFFSKFGKKAAEGAEAAGEAAASILA
ncbi:hypothetical protein J6A64_02545 [bacterium]|nr:hypothetical protein [bacterium]